MSTKEPIAIVGMACRFPGEINDPQLFWEALRHGKDAITEVPEGRWNVARYYHPNAAAPGRMVTRWGGFVANAESMDAAFFGITPREAARLDPQQRWLMEVTWEAIEDAGLPPETLAGTRAGVFVGISNTDYPMLQRGNRIAIDRYLNSGSALSIVANRLSYIFDFRGPSLATDTACSSSLVALHLAANSLRSGECDYAVVGGANSLITPEPSIGFSQAGMLSPRGRCRAFDAGADGYVRAEGAAAVLLMPLAKAQALGLESRALLIATAVNQDGRSSSLTVPSQRAQEELIREALRSEQVDSSDVVYVEAHGTGTTVGDRIEGRALAAVFKDQSSGKPLLIGSVKTNLGHLEPVSGLAGLLKAVLVLQHRAVPPNLHFEEPNPRLRTDRLQVPTALTPLPVLDGRVPFVAVNSFGFGGTNAHALLAPAPVPDRPAERPDGSCLFPLSARSPAALADYAESFARLIDENSAPSFSLHDLAAAAALGKSHHPLRGAIVADSLASLRAQLLTLRKSATELPPALPRLRIAFVFSGQGEQWWGMGRQLYESEKIVRDTWQECDELCRTLGGPHLLEALRADESRTQLKRTEIAQPALFALQAGLVRLWRAWGIEPDMVVGHSVGEAAAAWTAGICSLEAILRVIICRSRQQARLRGLGRMLVAGISADDARNWERKFAGRISIAAFNAPQQVTFSGEGDALAEIGAALKERKIFHSFLRIDYAFHSAQLDPIEADFRAELNGSSGCSAKVPMISTVTGAPIEGPELDADYWWRNARQPVRFHAAIERVLQAGCNALVEIGPHPVMASALAEIALAQKARSINVASLRRSNKDERNNMLQALATLYRHGAEVRWESLYRRPAQTIRLPAYPWQRQRLWCESAEIAREMRSAPSHPLLGTRQSHPQPTWLNHLDTRLLPWLGDHRVAGSAVLPAAAYLEIAAAAVREILGETTIFLEDVRFLRMLFLPEEQPVPVCVRLEPGSRSFQILAAPPDAPLKWEVYTEGFYCPGRLHTPPAADLEKLASDFLEERAPRDLYHTLGEMGLMYGSMFQGVTSLRLDGKESVLAGVTGTVERDSPDYLLFPPMLDSCFQSAAALKRDEDACVVAASIRTLRLFQPLPEKVWSHVRMVERRDRGHLGELTIYDSSGTVLAQIEGLRLCALETDFRRGECDLYRLEWDPTPAAVREVGQHAGEVLIFAEHGMLDLALGKSLRAQNVPVTFVFTDGQNGGHNGSALFVDPREDDWAIRLWNALAARGPLPERVIYLWSCKDQALSVPRTAEENCSVLLALIRARLSLTENGNARARWLIATRGAQQVVAGEEINPASAAVWGFARTLQTEKPEWQVSLVDLADPSNGIALLDELSAREFEPEVALRGGSRWVRRLRRFEIPEGLLTRRPPACELLSAQPGRIDTVQFRGRSRVMPSPGELEIEIAAAGLNFRDLMKVLGIYPLHEGERPTLGDEFSGKVVRVGRGVRGFRPGDRVMGFAPAGGAFGSHLRLPARLVWRIPAHLNDAEAASIPVVFGTAYHALETLARLRRGETVLIHAAAGGVGLAAVQLAQQIGAVVLATAGSEEKRAYLRSLGVALVMDSRTLDFADETLRYTGGRGVDVVLNSLAGVFQQKSLAVCAPHGRFVEIGKRDLFDRRALPLAAFQRSLSFFAFDLGAVLASQGAGQRRLRRFLAREFFERKLEPIARASFAASDAASAFRMMQGAQHTGKIVLEFDAARLPEVPAEFWPRTNATYLITGGSRGFGLATARWLAERGATHLALLSRRGHPAGDDAHTIAAMRAGGVSVITIAADVANPKALATALRSLKKSGPPLRGVFHAAMVLEDRTVAEMTRVDLEKVLAPKVRGAWNLHEQTLGMSLDCFVLFSSISAIVGAPGQANYAAANAFLDALAHDRRAKGLSGLSINWGQIADVGTVAARAEVGRYLTGIGVRPISSGDALEMLARLIAANTDAQVGVTEIEWEKLGRASAKFRNSPIFRDLVRAESATFSQGATAGEWRAAVLARPAEEQIDAVCELVLAQLAATLGMAPGEIDRGKPLTGIDSLMAVELKVRIENHAACELPIDLFSADLTVEKLAARLLAQMTRTGAAPAPSRNGPLPDQAETPGVIAAPFLRKETTPLVELIHSGKLQPLTAGALMSWSDALFDQAQVDPRSFFQRLNGSRVSFDLILETPLGSVGIFMVPLTTAQIKPGEPCLLPQVLDGLAQASACGAGCVALTGLLPSATGYGAAVQAACDHRSDLAALTTGHATTIAAVILNLQALLREANRELAAETVLFYGVGSIGLGALRLMLEVMPHPAELHLCDPFRSAAFFAELESTLRGEHRYEGAIRIVRPEGGDGLAERFFDASLIVGATNVPNVLDVRRLGPGTLIVDDSAPHCLNASAAFARLAESKDILFTEGGFLRSRAPMPRLVHVAPSIALGLPTELPQLLFSMLNPSNITACILSALLSARRPELPPTIGRIPATAARQHWAALAELGWRAAELNYEGALLGPELIADFRARFGNASGELRSRTRLPAQICQELLPDP